MLRTITQGKRRFALGLYWHLHPSALKTAEIKSLAAELPEAETYVTCQGDKTSGFAVGFAPEDALRKHGKTYALAATIAASLGPQGSLLATIQLPDQGEQPGGWWHLAIQNGLVLPDGDTVAETLDSLKALIAHHEAAERLPDLEVYEEFDAFIAPHINSRTLWQSALKTFTETQRKVKRAAVALIIIALVGAGGIAYHIHRQRIAAAAAARAAAAAAAARAAQQKKLRAEQSRVAHPPWSKIPAPAIFLEACAKRMDEAALSVVGWQIQTWQCGLKGISSVRVQTVGASPAVLPAGTKYLHPQSALASAPFPNLPRGRSEALLTEEPALAALYAVTAGQVDVRLGQRNPHGQSTSPKLPAGISVLYIKLRSNALGPRAIAHALDTVPGLRLTVMSANLTTSTITWSFQGVLYVANAT
jgi:hypothetical protein